MILRHYERNDFVIITLFLNLKLLVPEFMYSHSFSLRTTVMCDYTRKNVLGVYMYIVLLFWK